MRRLLLAAAIGTVVLGAAACSTDKTPDSPAQTGATGTGQIGGASLPAGASPAANGSKPGGAAGANAGDAALSGNTKAICNQAGKTTRDVENYSFALNDMSKLAADPTLKQALADMGRQVTALKGDVRKIDDKKLDKLRSTLDKACGK